MKKIYRGIVFTALLLTFWTVRAAAAPADFNGDGKTDFVVTRDTGAALAGNFGGASQRYWYIQTNGSAATGVVPWGIGQDWDVPEDYDGDDKTDAAVWRPSAGQAVFYILNSSNNTLKIEAFGQSGDIPTTVADYDGDGKADVSVYRCPNGSDGQCTWFYRGTMNNPAGVVTYVPWGFGHFGLLRNIRAVPGDYDGDGRADFCVHTNAGGAGRFWLLKSSGGYEAIDWGFDPFNDIPVPGDYDGDGKNDFAVVRSDGTNWRWYILERDGGGTGANPIVWGIAASDTFVPGDYDGDGKTDVAVWRNGANDADCNFFVRRSGNGAMLVFEWGANGDFPVAGWQID
ncbi:MAG: VCBS repeat-containing protein [Acidobacteria bacterium]|nr:VCBS repeat-containing protein [Acidobacteriota bacterium]